MMSAEALMNPLMTEWLRKFASTPKRRNPASISNRPTSQASNMATCPNAALPGWACMPAVLATISETMATGPTAR
ncbi:hypothetical protein D3C83_172350 [compost metagenome]